MMKGLIHITLAWIVVLNSMVYSVIKASFTLSRGYIIENFCVNKEKPELKCDGKCFLAKKIQEEKDRQESLPGFSFNKDFGLFINPSPLMLVAELGFKSFLFHSENYPRWFGQTATIDLDHPPQG